MKHWLLVGFIAILSVAFGYSQVTGPSQRTPPVTAPVSAASAECALLDQYCVTCHSDAMKKANLSLEHI
jgi:hypothetical protein